MENNGWDVAKQVSGIAGGIAGGIIGTNVARTFSGAGPVGLVVGAVGGFCLGGVIGNACSKYACEFVDDLHDVVDHVQQVMNPKKEN